MKLLFSDAFSLEITEGESETIITGFLKRLTKKQEQEIKTKFKKEFATIEKIGELAKKAQREKLRSELNNTSDVEEVKKQSSDLLDKLYELQDGIDEGKFKEDIAKFRFDLSIESAQMEGLLSLVNDYGYSFVLDMINKDVAEKKGNDKKAL